jgi:LPXTG-site transpeptidase (sortase) family protein
MSAGERGSVRVGSVVVYSAQVVIALALPIAFCAYAPASALTWAGVIVIALLGFALLHGGWAWLIPFSGAVAMASLFWQLPIPRDGYLFGSSALAFIVGALVIRAEVATNRRPAEPRGAATVRATGTQGFGSEQVTARMVDGSIFISWLAPASSGGYPVLNYEIQATFDGGSSWQTIRYVPASERAVMIDDLPGGSEVSFRVAAVNAAGSGTPSRPTTPFMPMGPPGPVSGVQGQPGDAQVRLTWIAPVSNGGYPIVDYVVQVSPDGGSTWAEVHRQPSPECISVASGLMNGHPYLFRVMAVNSRGRGRPSAPTEAVKPAGLPGPPFLQAYHGSDRSISVSWSPPAMDGGLPVLGYVIETSHDGGASWVLTDRPDGHITSSRITGLVNGIPYLIRISALNSVGRGPSSAPSSPVAPMGVPGEVGEVRVNAPALSYTDVIPQQPRARKPVARALVSAVLVLAGAALVGFVVMRTMQGDTGLEAGPSTLPSPGQTVVPTPGPGSQGEAQGGQNTQAPDNSQNPGNPQAPGNPEASASRDSMNSATSTQGVQAGSPVIEVPQAAASGQPSASPQAPEGELIGTLAFYRAGVPIITPTPYLVRQGVGPEVLQQGPGHYPNTPMPGTSGNSALAGHRTQWTSPFRYLDQLAPGDEISFTGLDGLQSRYVVDSTLVVGPDEAWVLGWDPLQAGMPTLTLTTSDPPNLDTRRLVVFARTAV